MAFDSEVIMETLDPQYEPIRGLIESSKLTFSMADLRAISPGCAIQSAGARNLLPMSITEHLPMIVGYCWNNLPIACCGSPEKVMAWIDFKRKQREMERLAKKGNEECQ
jgi:hypothetical protein